MFDRTFYDPCLTRQWSELELLTSTCEADCYCVCDGSCPLDLIVSKVFKAMLKMYGDIWWAGVDAFVDQIKDTKEFEIEMNSIADMLLNYYLAEWNIVLDRYAEEFNINL